MKRTAAILLALLAMAGSAQAMTVSAKVGPLIKEAQALTNAGNYKAALAKLDQAEAVKSHTDDATVINSMRQVITLAKLPWDYHEGNFRAVIADAATLQELHAMNAELAMVTAQAYYKAGDMRGCVKYLQENFYLSKDSTSSKLFKRCQQDL